MTDSIPLDALPGADLRRDGYGRYMVVPPGGSAPRGYTRVTTVAGTLDSGGGLAPWKAAMTAIGLTARKGLRSQWEALVAEHGGDPWYASAGGKSECKRLVEECAAVGGANDRREQGTSLHTLTALLDLGRPVGGLSEETQRDLDAYVTGMALAGIDVVPGTVEMTVVLDGYSVAGTLDRIVTLPGFDQPMIADLKTGADLSYSWQSIAVQLAAYAHADAVYVQGDAEDGSADQRLPMPEVDQSRGLILWLNAGTGKLEPHVVDLDRGWEFFGVSMLVREWRSLKNLATPLAVAADLSTALSASLAALDSRGPDGEFVGQLQLVTDEEAVAIVEAATTEAAAVVVDDYQPAPDADDAAELRLWLQGRVNAIGKEPKARVALGTEWPAAIPTLRTSHDHTPDQIAVIEALLTDIERRFGLEFPSRRPATETVAQVLDLFPGSTTTNNN